MIEFILYDDTTGRIQGTGRTGTVEQASSQETDYRKVMVVEDGLPDDALVYLDLTTGEFVPRPSLVLPTGPIYDLSALPAGSEIIVTNEDGDTLTVTDLSEPITLTDPGRYLFTILPPFPYQPIFDHVVNVNA